MLAIGSFWPEEDPPGPPPLPFDPMGPPRSPIEREKQFPIGQERQGVIPVARVRQVVQRLEHLADGVTEDLLGHPFPLFVVESKEGLASRLLRGSADSLRSTVLLMEERRLSSRSLDTAAIAGTLRAAVLGGAKLTCLVENLHAGQKGPIGLRMVQNDLMEAQRFVKSAAASEFFKNSETRVGEPSPMLTVIDDIGEEIQKIDDLLRANGCTTKRVTDSDIAEKAFTAQAQYARAAVRRVRTTDGDARVTHDPYGQVSDSDWSARLFKVLNALAHADEACALVVVFAFLGYGGPPGREHAVEEWMLRSLHTALDMHQLIVDRLSARAPAP